MTAALASWHPFIVHFAVAFAITSAALDAIDFLSRRNAFERTSFLLSLLAMPFLVAAALTGNLAARAVADPVLRAILETHETYANIAVWVFCAAGAWRLFLHLKHAFVGGKKILYVFMIAAAAMSVFLAAQRGGSIRHGSRAHPPAGQSLPSIPLPRSHAETASILSLEFRTSADTFRA